MLKIMAGGFFTLYFSQSKTDQEGVYKSIPWHLNSNPNNQVILSVNKLTMYILDKKKCMVHTSITCIKCIFEIIKYHEVTLPPMTRMKT